MPLGRRTTSAPFEELLYTDWVLYATDAKEAESTTAIALISLYSCPHRRTAQLRCLLLNLDTAQSEH